jgi:hypothetical protein
MRRALVERHPDLFDDDSQWIVMPRDQKVSGVTTAHFAGGRLAA